MMTFVDEYDIMVENLTKEWYAMNQSISSPKWEVPQYSRGQVERAGRVLSKADISDDERKETLKVLNNWRSSHAYPLQVIASNLRRNNPKAIVVQRLKRLDSIVGKLQRFQDMNLYRMQDLGGCRIIVDTLDAVYNTVARYQKSKIRHILKRENDYIQNPKTSGYRSYHMVYQFHSDKKDTYNRNMLIEVQVRTKLQHIWATAVEMMGIYTKTSLKSSMGDEDVLRFFTLVSSVFAIMEGTPVCPNTSSNRDDLIREIKKIDRKHNILSKLSALSTIIDYNSLSKDSVNRYYILRLDYETNILNIHEFEENDIKFATYLYDQIEKEHKPNIDTVLVSANSLDTVRTAYPNYFTDIDKFLDMMQEILKCDL